MLIGTNKRLDIDQSIVIFLFQTGSVTVATLRAYLQQQGVDGISKLIKADLVSKIKQLHNL